ncbi:MAG: imidazolonepropionase [Planctomycetes bacterium]|nr:imidazolonepropionase [Planctomycetota bacterium]
MSPRPAREPADLLVHGAAEIATPAGCAARSGRALGEIQVLRAAAVAVRDGRIAAVGPEAELRARFEPERELDARGGTVVPGFVDAHTHPVFDGTREDEFELRTRGASYLEIAAAGGGILSSVRGLRAASEEQLLARLRVRLDRFLEHGTTTIEAKSGYGLTTADELKSLRVLAAAAARHPVEIAATFLGAHDVPAEHRDDPARYVDLVEREMLPAVASAGLAEACDVFVEAHTFGLEASRRILARAQQLGFTLRLHADQLSLLGGARLAAEFGARSADHLEFVDDAGAEALAAAGVTAVLCPLVPLYLRQEREAPARRLVERGVPVALSTDFNPGSCYLQSLPQVLAWAALRYRFTAAEALTAATLNAAASLGRAHRLGSIEAGKEADLVVLDVPNHLHLVYELGRNAVRAVVKGGRVVLEREPAAPILGARGPGGSNGAGVR